MGEGICMQKIDPPRKTSPYRENAWDKVQIKGGEDPPKKNKGCLKKRKELLINEGGNGKRDVQENQKGRGGRKPRKRLGGLLAEKNEGVTKGAANQKNGESGTRSRKYQQDFWKRFEREKVKPKANPLMRIAIKRHRE